MNSKEIIQQFQGIFQSFPGVFERLEKLGQEHLKKAFNALTLAQKNEFKDQLFSFQFLEREESFPKPLFNPAVPIMQANEDEENGKKLLRQGKAACVILAAGQGTRLGFNGPKGLFPISVVKKKSLFQLFCEKIKAAENQLTAQLELAIMCSKENEKDIRRFFQENRFFGLLQEQIHFFVQTELPLMDGEGKWFLDALGKIATGPDGNGSFYPCFQKTLLKEFRAKGIEHLFVIPVDNPLADPFNASLLGFHARLGNEVSVIAVELKDHLEKMGVIVSSDGKMRVMEYIHIDSNELKKAIGKGKVYANTNLFCLSLSFIEKAASALLPRYSVKKEIEQKEVYKWEKFIFDAFSLSERIEAVSYPKDRCYAPLKSRKSIPDVQKALLRLDQEILRALTRKQIDDVPLELDMAFHYPTPDLISKWENKKPLINAGAYFEKEG